MSFGLAASLRLALGSSPQPEALNYLLLASNGPGILIAAIPFLLVGGLTTAHAGLLGCDRVRIHEVQATPTDANGVATRTILVGRPSYDSNQRRRRSV